MKLETEIKFTEKKIAIYIDKLTEKYKGRKVKIKFGKYKGRTAIIQDFHNGNSTIFIGLKIPRKDGEGYLWDHVDARRGYSPREVELL